MSIVLVGLSHHTAPVALREKLALAGCSLRMALEDLRELSHQQESNPLNEAVVLSTCNRLEVYASVDDAAHGTAALARFLGALQNMHSEELAPHLYQLEDDNAITHLMRVSSGLDSMILGEPQILGQVKQAYEEARLAGATGPILSRLFAQSIHAGKRARAETSIGRHTTSVAHVGAQRVVNELPEKERRVLVVGAGEMAALVAEVLDRCGPVELAFINRTFNRAEAMAAERNGRALAWHQLEEGLVWANAVISATGAPHTVIYRQDLVPVLAQRHGRPLILVDLSVPRDIEDLARDLPGIVYHDIDDLQSVLDEYMELRRAAIPHVEDVVAENVAEFNEWLSGRQVTPVIRSLRDWAEGVATEELESALSRMPAADERTRELVARLARRLVQRLLHEPTTRLRMQAADGNGYGYAHALSELFALDDTEMQCPRDREGCTTPEAPPGTACNLECMGQATEARPA